MARFWTRSLAAGAAALAVLAGGAPVAMAQPSTGPSCSVSPGDPAATVNDLRFGCSVAEYDALYRALGPGAIPQNVTAQGYVKGNPVAELVWQGKVFGTGTVANRVVGLEALPASVGVGPSFADGAPAILIDYAGGPLGFIRDEIRQVQPGVYMGFAYDRSGAPRVVERFILVL